MDNWTDLSLIYVINGPYIAQLILGSGKSKSEQTDKHKTNNNDENDHANNDDDNEPQHWPWYIISS